MSQGDGRRRAILPKNRLVVKIKLLMKYLKVKLEKLIFGAILGLLAVIFFTLTASFNYFRQQGDFIKWSSPDETANYTFAKLYAQTGELQFFEKYNLLAGDLIHPRSIRSDNGVLKPVSFLGLPLIYGQIGKIFGIGILPYLTPILGAIGLIFFALLLRQFFPAKIALSAAALLTFFPPYVYYSARSFFHNVPFTVFLITGLYFISLMVKAKAWARIWTSALAGLFIGGAIITRTSELLWLAPVLLIIWLFYLKKIGIFKLLMFLAFMGLAVLPVLYWNQVLYGSFFSGGYNEMNTSLQSLTNLTASGQNLQTTAAKIGNTIFYFGFKPWFSLRMFQSYFVNMFWWIFWPAVIGFLIFILKIKKWRRPQYLYFLIWGITSVVLILYYGSWKFTDNPDPTRFTIGNSYTRYWLPVYLGALPLAAICLNKIAELVFFRLKSLVNCGRIVLIGIVALISVNFVYFGSEEGLMYGLVNNNLERKIYHEILDRTEGDAVIITRYHDKLFFPERKVILGLLNDKQMNYYYRRLLGKVPVYYFNFTLPRKDVEYLNERPLKESGFSIIPLTKIDSFSLYKLVATSTTAKIENKK